MWVLSCVCGRWKRGKNSKTSIQKSCVYNNKYLNLALDFKGIACCVKTEKKVSLIGAFRTFQWIRPFTSFMTHLFAVRVCFDCVSAFSGHNVLRYAHNDWLTVIGSHPLNTPPYIEKPPPRGHKQHLEKGIKRVIEWEKNSWNWMCEAEKLLCWFWHPTDRSLSFYRQMISRSCK